jgi:hypothetical protein
MSAAKYDGANVFPDEGGYQAGTSCALVRFSHFGNAQKPVIAVTRIERGGMSSADPTDVGSTTLASGDSFRRGRSSENRPAKTSGPALQEETDVRSEKAESLFLQKEYLFPAFLAVVGVQQFIVVMLLLNHL